MLKGVLYYIAPKPSADAITSQEAEELYKQRIQLEQKIKVLEQRIKDLSNVQERTG
jgi:hypothetical protein